MCEIYSGTEVELFALKSKSVRIDGVVTSIRLEAVFWKVIEDISNESDISVAEFLTRIYNEVIEKRGEVGNFTSLLRVACTTYLNGGQRLSLG
ncbi:ribbon-helix-helix domain-containing protein [Vibrio renipiscarius]|uniref:Arylsulfate sulfotransferase n=1 Tax=Vibrio renipiscarius TaxID=1461322 RepID=A0A0C2NMF9_9VIBR|nr:ribbon-helix-helix domain-containing protein [Vibrio renipiscarius]KII77485.1 arylsulfate sulfotransferase [Vibrio renipiscarius]KII81347.1 arylsulfate sulfotransferase [Vibrio renipiscarius]